MKLSKRVYLKKYLIILYVTALVSIILFGGFINYQNYKLNQNYNRKINDIVGTIKNSYPNVSDEEILNILNDKNSNNKNYLSMLGIDLQKDILILENAKELKINIIVDSVLLLLIINVLIFIFLKYDKCKSREIEKIIKTIEEINRKNYEISVIENTEDELSILKNEIYKTTVMLREVADNSLKDKIKLKESLENISHQLKTPLTSILIMLDNLIDNENMSQDKKIFFINNIRREITNINFLVLSLLKLSRFDVNVVVFKKELVSVDEIINTSIQNVAMICDLKNVSINYNNDSLLKIKCDKKWQIEAITNILKNCVEHSYENSKIDVSVFENNVYTLVEIKDYGKGIEKEDINHIFDRFYKGKNSSNESIGIGLSLSKVIINHDNGIINVSSSINEGSIFTIKYFK